MISSQAIKILRSLDEKEIEMLNDFIYSPFFNKSKTIIKFWEILKKLYPDFKDDLISKERIFTLTFSGKKYNYGTMKNLIHNFTQLIEKFLEIKFHEEDKFQHDYNTLVYSIVKYYPDHFKKKYGRMMKDFSKIREGEDYHYLYKYQLLRLSTSFAALESKMDKALFEQGDSLIYFFLIHLFQVNFNMRIFYNSKNYEQKDNLVDEIIGILDLEKIMKKIKENSEKDFKVVNLYYHMYLSVNAPENDEYFYKYKQLLLDARKIIHEYEFDSMANGVINTLQNRSYMGVKGTGKEISEFLKLLIKLKINFCNTESIIPTDSFVFNLKHFMEAGDPEYANIFYEKYKSKLIEEDKKNMENLHKAYLDLFDKKYNQALESTVNIRNESQRYKNFIKSFQLKCYYELGEAEAFSYTLKAYRLLVYRKETINKSRKDLAKKFLTVINMLFEYKIFRKGRLDDIKMEIETNRMLNKEWIISKFHELAEINTPFIQ